MIRQRCVAVLLLVGVVLWSPVLGAQEEQPAAESPLFTPDPNAEGGEDEVAAALPQFVAPQERYNLGALTQGEVATAEFRIENQGNAPLEILKVVSVKACKVELDTVIPPGESRTLRATLDTTTRIGGTEIPIAVFTNDPSNLEFHFTLIAEVISHVAVHPGGARYVVVQGFEEKGTVTHTLWPHSDQGEFDLEILSIESPYPFLDVRFREPTEEDRDPVAKGRQWRVEMELSPDSPVGPIADHVLVRIRHEKQKVVSIPVSGFIRPMFAVTPPVADLGQVEITDHNRTVDLHVKNFASAPYELTKVEHDLQGVEAEISSIREGHVFNVRLILQPEMPKGRFNGSLRIHTSSTKKPVLHVEIKGTIL